MVGGEVGSQVVELSEGMEDLEMDMCRDFLRILWSENKTYIHWWRLFVVTFVPEA